MDPLIALRRLIVACGNKGHIIAYGSAPEDARRDFGLLTKPAIYSFIANNGLESPVFINERLWANDKNQKNPASVYAFSFYTGPKFGYIAFILSNQTGKWLIKSLKKNEREDPRALPSVDQLLELKKKLEDK